MTQYDIDITRVYKKVGKLLIKPFTGFRNLPTDGNSHDSAENELSISLAFLFVLAAGLFLHIALSGYWLVLVFVWVWMLVWMYCFFVYCILNTTFFHLKAVARKEG